MAANVNVFHNEKGEPIIVQMGMADYEQLVTRASEAMKAKEKIEKTLELLKL